MKKLLIFLIAIATLIGCNDISKEVVSNNFVENNIIYKIDNIQIESYVQRCDVDIIYDKQLRKITVFDNVAKKGEVYFIDTLTNNIAIGTGICDVYVCSGELDMSFAIYDNYILFVNSFKDMTMIYHRLKNG